MWAGLSLPPVDGRRAGKCGREEREAVESLARSINSASLSRGGDPEGSQKVNVNLLRTTDLCHLLPNFLNSQEAFPAILC